MFVRLVEWSQCTMHTWSTAWPCFDYFAKKVIFFRAREQIKCIVGLSWDLSVSRIFFGCFCFDFVLNFVRVARRRTFFMCVCYLFEPFLWLIINIWIIFRSGMWTAITATDWAIAREREASNGVYTQHNRIPLNLKQKNKSARGVFPMLLVVVGLLLVWCTRALGVDIVFQRMFKSIVSNIILIWIRSCIYIMYEQIDKCFCFIFYFSVRTLVTLSLLKWMAACFDLCVCVRERERARALRQGHMSPYALL